MALDNSPADLREADESPGATAPPRRFWRSRAFEGAVLVTAALIGAFGTKTFIAQVYSIPSASMESTVSVGERVAIEKVSYWAGSPSRGEVVVFDGRGLFSDPAPGEHVFVKRIIGIGGDRVMCCDAAGKLSVNGVTLDEAEYLYAGDQPSSVGFDIQVPAGKLWMMGDHRSDSADSRRYIGFPGGGFIPEDRVIGRVMGVVWPFDSARAIGVPGTFAQAGLNQP